VNTKPQKGIFKQELSLRYNLFIKSNRKLNSKEKESFLNKKAKKLKFFEF
jgi:hypothetical protein